MYYTVYILENQHDKTWYTGMSSNLKQRIKQHLAGQSTYTAKKPGWKLIYAELYLTKQDASGREKFLKSGAGKKFIRKQLTHYFSDHAKKS
ncbi:GIY-YIG nuclease family protein [Candidatus Falkowbacteria bacterium]|nr:GIY-YIG nuclease family protein [Candidatus Falkowbacteria bacterium]